MGKKGVIPDASVRLRITATNQLESILGEDEPREAQWFLRNLKQIAQRYGIKNSANPDTTATYESRARRLLTDYFAYLQNPTGFSPRVAAPRARRKEREEEAQPETSKVSASKSGPSETQVQTPVIDPPPPPSPAATLPKLHEVQLGKDKEPFRYVMPEAGLTMADVHRIAITLAANSHDFDPMTSQVVVKNRITHGEE